LRDQYDLTQRIQIENGSNFFSTVMDRGAYTDGLTADYSRPGKLISNPFMESFNGKSGMSASTQKGFLSLDDVCEDRKLEDRLQPFPDPSSIGDVPPAEFFARYAGPSKAEISSSAGADTGVRSLQSS